jgi:curved DNA-binding protein
MDFKDYYKVLDVPPEASADEIKKAFRKAARAYHPDINTAPDSEARFKDVNEAFEVLKDPERRAAYDELRKGPQPGSGPYRAPPDWDNGYQFSDGGGGGPQHDEGFSDFFETLFRRGQGQGQGYSQGRAAPGSDSHAKMQIDIEDAYRGDTKTLALRMPVVGPNGAVTLKDRNISVRIPKGIRAGQTIRLAGQGAPSFDAGPAGDLFLEIAFAPHPVFRPDGRDLYLDLPIAPWEAALGSHVVMPTPAGKVDLSIPKNARNGQRLRLKGKGLPGTPAGDIYATLVIVNPKVSTDKARALFEQMAQEMPFDPRAHLGG